MGEDRIYWQWIEMIDKYNPNWQEYIIYFLSNTDVINKHVTVVYTEGGKL